MATNPTGPACPSIPLDIVIRKTCENVAQLVIRVHNQNVEIQSLRNEIRQCVALIVQLVDSSEAREHAKAVMKDFQFNKSNPK